MSPWAIPVHDRCQFDPRARTAADVVCLPHGCLWSFPASARRLYPDAELRAPSLVFQPLELRFVRERPREIDPRVSRSQQFGIDERAVLEEQIRPFLAAGERVVLNL